MPRTFCTNCGRELGEGAAFCPECGAPAPAVEDETVTHGLDAIPEDYGQAWSAPADATRVAPAVAPAPEPARQAASGEATARRPVGLVVAVCALAACVVALVVAFVVPSVTGRQLIPGVGVLPAADQPAADDGSDEEEAAPAEAADDDDDEGHVDDVGSDEADEGHGYDSPSIGTPSDDYVLPDSADRVYSEADLQGLSDYELYLARNEIYARHGRIFRNDDLRVHFGSKSWYRGTVEPEDFDDQTLNDCEKANRDLIRQIEQERGSQYLA